MLNLLIYKNFARITRKMNKGIPDKFTISGVSHLILAGLKWYYFNPHHKILVILWDSIYINKSDRGNTGYAAVNALPACPIILSKSLFTKG